MKDRFIQGTYRSWIHHLYSSLEGPFERSSFTGRLLALPVGLLIAFLFIPFKCLFFIEEVWLFFINLFGASTLPNCSIANAKAAFRNGLLQLLGLIISPLTAIFVGVAVATSIFIHPGKAMRRLKNVTDTYARRD